MNKPTPEQRARALRQAEGIMHLLEETLPRIDPSTNPEEFEQACSLYAQGVLIKLRLTPAPSL
jgi:hypothetical protein